MKKAAICSGTTHPELAAAICRKLRTRLSPTTITRFSNDRLSTQLNANCREADRMLKLPMAPGSKQRLSDDRVVIDVPRMHVLSIAPLLADTIKRVDAGQSVSTLFDASGR